MAEENKVESGVVLPPADFTERLQKEAQEMGVTLNEHQIKQSRVRPSARLERI